MHYYVLAQPEGAERTIYAQRTHIVRTRIAIRTHSSRSTHELHAYERKKYPLWGISEKKIPPMGVCFWSFCGPKGRSARIVCFFFEKNTPYEIYFWFYEQCSPQNTINLGFLMSNCYFYFQFYYLFWAYKTGLRGIICF